MGIKHRADSGFREFRVISKLCLGGQIRSSEKPYVSYPSRQWLLEKRKKPILKIIAISKEVPKKFKWINWFILIPILYWPLVFFGTIFFFDDPNANPLMVWALFIGVNLYPLYLIILFELNARLFKKVKVLPYVLPLLMIGSLSFLIVREYV